MTTKRKRTQSISIAGVQFTREVVNSHNSIFQEVALENDIGNDAYVEFIQDEEATGCCVFVQIKSGNSYVKSDGNYILKSDKNHFEYWSSHALPIACIIYSPKNNQAAWYDVTEYLSHHPNVIENGPYTITVPSSQTFSTETFAKFKEHFLQYLEPYKKRLGIALQKFSERNNHQNCMDGLKHLFTFQRHNFASWYYILSCYRNFRGHPILSYLTSMIGHLPAHGDILWHGGNYIKETTRNKALHFLSESFSKEEVLTMLEIVTDGGGFARGAIGQSIYAILLHVKNREDVLESIFTDVNVNDESRYWSLLLLVYFQQLSENGVDRCIALIDTYQHLFSDIELKSMAKGLKEELKAGRFFELFF